MYRSHTCGELRLSNCGQNVVLCGWLQRQRDKGSLIWLDLRDRYGITQIILDESTVSADMMALARSLGREYVIKVSGKVVERSAKNEKMDTGQIEILPQNIEILNPAKLPPFMIEDQTDGGDELRMKYRYLDLRRTPVRQNLELRHRMAQHIRRYLDQAAFLEVETPVLIKSTPEGARDFVVPSRMNAGQFYALPQSPQTFKQLLMVAGFDRYFQIVKCFRDEDLRADRQPEFTQIDCEMAFVEQQDVLEMFEGLVQYLFEQVKGFRLPDIMRMNYADAMHTYGSDKPDTRFEMPFVHLTELVKGFGFAIFDAAESVIGIRVEKSSGYSRKQLDELTEFVRRPQLGASGLFYLQCRPDGSLKSSVDKFYDQNQLNLWASESGLQPDDLLLIVAGPKASTYKAMSELRLEMGSRLGLRDKNKFAALWVVDFPLLEWDEQSQRYHAMHHPFTAPKPEDTHLLDTNPGLARANAYDMVINGVEVGGGSVRIHHANLQAKMFGILGFEQADAKAQFGFLMDAFEFGAPPHAGIAFGFDRLCALFGGADSIRDFIAFPKNNSGRDVMIDSPSNLDESQLKELHIMVNG